MSDGFVVFGADERYDLGSRREGEARHAGVAGIRRETRGEAIGEQRDHQLAVALQELARDRDGLGAGAGAGVEVGTVYMTRDIATVNLEFDMRGRETP